MTTIVMNTLTGAITEYGWSFQSITPVRATSGAGLLALGGDTDAGAPIASEIRSGLTGGQKRLGVANVYVGMKSAGSGAVIVQGESGSWEYPLEVRASGVSRVKPGKGIEENYLGFGYRNTGGADFHLERIDAEITESKTRRLG